MHAAAERRWFGASGRERRAHQRERRIDRKFYSPAGRRTTTTKKKTRARVVIESLYYIVNGLGV